MATEKTYLDVNAQDFSEATQALIAAQRQTYLADKAAKALVVAAINAETPCKAGESVVGTTFTRWGQMQLIVGAKAEAKAKAKARPTLADYLAEQSAAGQQG